MLAFSLAWAAVVFLLVARALRQRKLFHEVQPLKTPLGNHPRVALIVPARNEEANIAPCIGSLLAQRYPEARLSIVAVDDNSTDSTASVLEGLASASGRVTLLRAPELPAGWTGKSHACWIAARTVLQESEWLCFVDADIEAQPDLIGNALAHAASQGIDFLSLTPRQTLLTFSERLMLPCGLYLLAFRQDLGPAN